MTKSVLICHGCDVFDRKLLNTIYLEHFDIVISPNEEEAEYLKCQCELNEIQCELYSAALMLESKLSGEWGESLFPAKTKADVWLIVIMGTIIMSFRMGVDKLRNLLTFLWKLLLSPTEIYLIWRAGPNKIDRGETCIKK